MKKILLGFIMDGHGGGVDNYLLNFVDAVWQEGVQIDLLTNKADTELKKALGRYGAHLYETANLKHPLRQFRQVRYLIRKEGYEIVYLNVSTSMDMIAAFAARSCGVPRRILHSHSGGNDCESVIKRMIFDILQKMCRPVFYRAGNEYCGCSKKAGYWMFPKKIVESNRFQVIYNAVNRDRFAYLPSVRSKVRRELELEGRFVIGTVGNLTYVKNHGFLLQVFSELKKRERDAVLLLVGDGIRRKMTEDQAEALGLAGSVRFLGRRSDVDRLMQAMDVFVLPSWFEGLPTVGIEAQCTGLPCVISDTVTEETRITDRCCFVSLKKSAEYWAEKILEMKELDRSSVRYMTEAEVYDLRSQQTRLKALIADR